MIRHQAIGAGIILGILGGIVLNTYTQSNPSHLVYAAPAEPPREILIGVQIDWTPERIEKEIEDQAAKYGKDADRMKKIIECESMGSTTVQSHHVRNGKREESYGLVQIHLPSHPTVTYEQAIDPKFAIEFLAKNLGTVKWSCEKLI